MTTIAIVNKSTLVSANEVKTMTRAVATQMRNHVAPAYGAVPVPVIYLDSPAAVQPGMQLITLFDDPDQADALGWHTEEKGVVYGKVFARPSLDNGSKVFSGQYAVSSILSHEVIETFGNPSVNKWSTFSQYNYAYAYELCDPVEDQGYQVKDVTSGKSVTVSNFVLPSWFDEQAPAPYDYLHKLNKPLTMTPGGYTELLHKGVIVPIRGEAAPAWRTESKLHQLSRSRKIETRQLDAE